MPVPDGAQERGTWLVRHNTPITVVCAGLTPLLYLIFVHRFAVNSLFGDDWSTVPVIDQALHGHFSLGALWSQYNETRIPVIRLVLILFAYGDRFDTRSVIYLNALVFVASYGVVIVLYRRYIVRPLTPLPVLLIGVTWFSIADVETAFWAFQIGWYLVVLSYLVSMYALMVPRRSTYVWLAVAISAGCICSLSFSQGIIVWPLGTLFLWWTQRHSPRFPSRLGLWVTGAVLCTGIYLLGFNFGPTGCVQTFGCTPGVAYGHPLRALQFLILLIGNVFPGGNLTAVGSLARYEVVGALLLLASLAILVQSWRHRDTTDRLPVPVMLISFALLFDVIIVLGRTGTGPDGAINGNRYLLANLILLTGIVIYCVARLPAASAFMSQGSARPARFWLSWGALLLVVGVQVSVATNFGLRDARAAEAYLVDSARLAVNLDRVPVRLRSCEEFDLFGSSRKALVLARSDHLAEFNASSYPGYRRMGPPPVPPGCAHLGLRTPASSGP